MKTFIRVRADGRILAVGSCADADLPLQPGYPDQLLEIPAGALVGVESHYVRNGEVSPLPAKPAGAAQFDYAVGQWVADAAAQLASVRVRRAELLHQSDWTQLPDAPLQTKAAWATYRQALRDITTQPDLFNIIWPTPPQ